MVDSRKVSKERIAEMQRFLNRWTKRWLRGVKPLVVDGVKGHATNSRIMAVKFYLGYGSNRDGSVTREFLDRMHAPRDGKRFPRGMVTTGIKRRARQKARWAAEQGGGTIAPGVTRYDGVPVAKVAVPILKWCRAHGWRGKLVSGWRSPAYSESLCIRMCGRPSCPGRCAGRASNHVGNSASRFAVDVSDYANFERIVARCPIRPRIRNALARDPAHFSPTGR